MHLTPKKWMATAIVAGLFVTTGTLGMADKDEAKAVDAHQVESAFGIPNQARPASVGDDGAKIIVTLASRFGGNLGPAAIAQLQDTAIRILGLNGAEELTRFKYTPNLAFVADRDLIRRLEASPLIERVEPDRLNMPSLSQSTDIVGADEAWKAGSQGQGMTVAVLDTGVDTSHRALKGRIAGEACFSTNGSFQGNRVKSACPGGKKSATGKGAGRNCPDEYECSHGTHVAGIVAGNDNRRSGVAPKADILAVQVFSKVDGNACGRKSKCVTAYTSDIMKGLEWVYDQRKKHNIAAANLSLGGGRYKGSCDRDALARTVNLLSRAGIAVVVASGNESYTDSVASPACVSEAVTVGATDKRDGVARYSNSNKMIDVWATGSDINAPVPGGRTETKSGTSMAAPHVAGAIAILKGRYPKASLPQIVSLIKSEGPTVRDRRNGVERVRLDLGAAIRAGDAKFGAPDGSTTPEKPDDRDSGGDGLVPALLDGLLGGGS